MYINLLKQCRQHPEVYRHVIPLPGPFHLGLNAQEAMFDWFGPIVQHLWTAVFPGKRFVCVMQPLHRKFLLDLLCRAWKDARNSCLSLGIRRAHWPSEVSSILLFFEEYLPLSLDVYAIFLSGDFEAYEAALYRALQLFAQVGKVHYVQCILLYISTIDFWRTHHPAFFEAFRKNYHYTSEEEVEIFHSLIRKCTGPRCDLDTLVRRINFTGAMQETLMEWRDATDNKTHHGGLPVDHAQETVSAMSAAIKHMFEDVIQKDVALQEAENDKWTSAVLGEIPDRMLPIALQRKEWVYGYRGSSMHDIKVKHGGMLRLGQRTLCGHVVEKGTSCARCKEMMRILVTTVLSNCAL